MTRPKKKAAKKKVANKKTTSAESTAKTTTKPVRGRPFKKGQSGNPKGRPKGSPNLSRKLIEALEDNAQKRGVHFVDFILDVATDAAAEPSERKQARDICATWVNKLVKVEEVEKAAATKSPVKVIIRPDRGDGK